MGLSTDRKFWMEVLHEVFAAGDKPSLRQSKVLKRAVKAAAAKGLAGSKAARQASLEAFLHEASSQRLLRVEDGRVSMEPPAARQPTPPPAKKRKLAATPAAASGPAVESQPAKDSAASLSAKQALVPLQPGLQQSTPARAQKPKKRKQAAATAEQAQQPDTAASELHQQASTATAPSPAGAAGATAPAPQKKRKRKAVAEGQPVEPAGSKQSLADADTPAKQPVKRKKAAAKATAAPNPASQTPDTPSATKRREKAAQGTSREGASPAKMPSIGGAEPSTDASLTPNAWKAKRTDIKSGRFSKAETALLRQTVEEYARAHGQDTTDLAWLYKVRLDKDTQGAWKEIAACLPHRTIKAVWAHGTRILHEGNYQGKWSADEDALLTALVQSEGQKWKVIGSALGRIPEGCRDRWREIRLGDRRKRGAWGDDEVARLRAAVEDYLALKQEAEGSEQHATLSLDDIAAADAKPDAAGDGRVVLDDIDWGLISDRVGTRSHGQCMDKWYNQLCPSMVSKGEWGSGDDRRLLRGLLLSGARQEWEVDWGDLVAGRGPVPTRRRWRLMLKCVPDRSDKDFRDCLDFLVDSYCPGLREKLQSRRQEGHEG